MVYKSHFVFVLHSEEDIYFFSLLIENWIKQSNTFDDITSLWIYTPWPYVIRERYLLTFPQIVIGMAIAMTYIIGIMIHPYDTVSPIRMGKVQVLWSYNQ